MQHLAVEIYTLTGAAQALSIPPATLRDLERRGVVGPFQRDSASRRLLTPADLDAVRHYLETRAARSAA